jgi:hypothetical protein
MFSDKGSEDDLIHWCYKCSNFASDQNTQSTVKVSCTASSAAARSSRPRVASRAPESKGGKNKITRNEGGARRTVGFICGLAASQVAPLG